MKMMKNWRKAEKMWFKETGYNLERRGRAESEYKDDGWKDDQEGRRTREGTYRINPIADVD
ncbi:hypothetical protein Dda_9181 [Drechslerella dactyloides]|uniref:Uncharacterized protein n=1 Tax=Drechslerella dactyloides TaxID=74499 RepID=A0AAD6NFE6_DREDA|nr:hypothetical protein Dda_9181 [Drechslerella dactyloides]